MSIVYKIQKGIGTVTFDTPDSKVNILTAETLKRFDAILDEIRNNSANLEAVLIVSAKQDIFIAGADIKEIDGITSREEGMDKAAAGQDIFNKLEDLPVPTIAVIDGVALGGGCELALACRYRVATFNEKVTIGLPEVNLGILPGFGGTYRLPRLVGLTEGLGIILAGKSVDAQKALRIGLVDRLIPQRGMEGFLAEFVNEVKGKNKRPGYFRKKKKGFPGFLDGNWLGQQIVFDQARQNTLKQTKGFYPAPVKALETIQCNFYMNRTDGLKAEREAFGELVGTDVSKNLINVFYLTERFKKLSVPDAEGIKPKKMSKVGVLGAGVMGGGIAQILAYKDINVRLKDINHDAVAKGFQAAARVFGEAVKRRRLTEAQARVKMARITGTTDYSGFGNADAVIEAVVENMGIKKKVFAEAAGVLSSDAVLLTNTSALSITDMAADVPNPSRVAGFHFFNPVHRMPLVEVIYGKQTSRETLVAALGLARTLGKTPILVKDAPGFLVNRVLLAYINEAGHLWEEGADIETLDKIMTDFGMPMGPFLLSDEVGLDVGAKVMHILYEGLGERFKPSPVFDQLLTMKLLGKKNGKGFYIHSGKERRVNPDLPHPSSGGDGSVPLQEYLDRMVLIMVNEAARCLEEKIVSDPDSVDVGMIMGTGFPPFRGGLLRYADNLPAGYAVDALARFAHRPGYERFTPCEYLLNLRNQNKKFYSK